MKEQKGKQARKGASKPESKASQIEKASEQEKEQASALLSQSRHRCLMY